MLKKKPTEEKSSRRKSTSFEMSFFKRLEQVLRRLKMEVWGWNYKKVRLGMKSQRQTNIREEFEASDRRGMELVAFGNWRHLCLNPEGCFTKNTFSFCYKSYFARILILSHACTWVWDLMQISSSHLRCLQYKWVSRRFPHLIFLFLFGVKSYLVVLWVKRSPSQPNLKPASSRVSSSWSSQLTLTKTVTSTWTLHKMTNICPHTSEKFDKSKFHQSFWLHSAHILTCYFWRWTWVSSSNLTFTISLWGFSFTRHITNFQINLPCWCFSRGSSEVVKRWLSSI